MREKAFFDLVMELYNKTNPKSDFDFRSFYYGIETIIEVYKESKEQENEERN